MNNSINLLDFPDEILVKIVSFVDRPSDREALAQTCTHLYSIVLGQHDEYLQSLQADLGRFEKLLTRHGMAPSDSSNSDRVGAIVQALVAGLSRLSHEDTVKFFNDLRQGKYLYPSSDIVQLSAETLDAIKGLILRPETDLQPHLQSLAHMVDRAAGLQGYFNVVYWIRNVFMNTLKLDLKPKELGAATRKCIEQGAFRSAEEGTELLLRVKASSGERPLVPTGQAWLKAGRLEPAERLARAECCIYRKYPESLVELLVEVGKGTTGLGPASALELARQIHDGVAKARYFIELGYFFLENGNDKYAITCADEAQQVLDKTNGMGRPVYGIEPQQRSQIEESIAALRAAICEPDDEDSSESESEDGLE